MTIPTMKSVGLDGTANALCVTPPQDLRSANVYYFRWAKFLFWGKAFAICAAAIIASLAVVFVLPLSGEDKLRTLGASYQLIGLITVVIGVVDRIRVFQVSLRALFDQWWSSRPRRVHDLKANSLTVGSPVFGRPMLRSCAKPNSDIEERVKVIEGNIDSIYKELNAFSNRCNEVENRIDDETTKVRGAIEALGGKFGRVRAIMSEGTPLELIGIVLLVFGIYLGTVPCRLLPGVSCASDKREAQSVHAVLQSGRIATQMTTQ
jgi:hypothetical protein